MLLSTVMFLILLMSQIYPSVCGIHPSHENHCAAATLCSPKRDDVLSAISPNIPPALSPSPSMKYQSCNYNDAHAGTPYDLSLSCESTLALEHNRMLYAEVSRRFFALIHSNLIVCVHPDRETRRIPGCCRKQQRQAS